MRKLLIALLAVPLLALGLASCDNGTYTVGTHSDLNTFYVMEGKGTGSCTLAQGSTSMTAGRFVAYSDGARNGQQYGLVNCDAFKYPDQKITWKGGVRTFDSTGTHFLIGIETPQGFEMKAQGVGFGNCMYRLHIKHPGQVGWGAGSWQYMSGGVQVTVPGTASGIEVKAFSSGISCSIDMLTYSA